MNTAFNLIAEKQFKANLEAVIDSKGMNYVLMALSEICYEKSSHTAENWQDEVLAKQWDKTGSKIDKLRLNKSFEDNCPLY